MGNWNPQKIFSSILVKNEFSKYNSNATKTTQIPLFGCQPWKMMVQEENSSVTEKKFLFKHLFEFSLLFPQSIWKKQS
jgi:hypothetical protein